MEASNSTEILKTEPMDTNEEQINQDLNIDENIVIDENTEILTINNDSNIQLEFFDVKNFDQNELIIKNSQNLEEENKVINKELTLLQEKFSILHSQVQNQAKLIELLVRLDMIKSDDEPNKKELEDLHRKISLCYNLIEECTLKYNELCNEKRRVLLVSTNEPEKRAAIWDHFTILADTDGQNKNAECNYCRQCFNYKNLTANKCREHIHERCERAPESIKTKKPPSEPKQKSKYTIWNYFLSSERDGKTFIVCMYCGIEYSSKNATKCREHLAFKCTKVTDEISQLMRATFSQEFINSFSTSKRSTIWEHFHIVDDEDKTVIQCIYCCMNYANKNATKCREHLLERCDKIPIAIRHKINNSFYESPLKTWTQVKISIWKHFAVIPHKDRKIFKCNYCKKLYASKNVTKFRLHLLYKCEQITDEAKAMLNYEVSRSSFKSDDIGDHEMYNENDEMEEQQEEPQIEVEEENIEDKNSEIEQGTSSMKNDEHQNDSGNDDLGNDDIANDDIANDDLGNDDIANDDIANDDIANDDLANDDLSDAETKPVLNSDLDKDV